MSTLALSLRKRTFALFLAVLLAALATVALVSYVRGLQDKAFEGAETVSVFVAKDAIPLGMSAEDALARGLIERRDVPRKVLVAGALTSLADIQGKVATATILPGEQIADARFSTTANASGTALPIPKGKQALAVAVSVPHGVAGFIRPGNHVSLIGWFELVGKDLKDLGLSGSKEARYLVQNVLVLAVDREVTGQTTTGEKKDEDAEASNQDAQRVLLTLALTPFDAEKVAYSAFGGDNLWITLLPDGQPPVRTPGRNALNIAR